MKQAAVLLMAAMVLAVAGCGAPQYAKDVWTIDPQTGKISHYSSQEVDLILGTIEAGVGADGSKTLKVGTTTQPAITYGTKSVAAMIAYRDQQVEYTKMLDVVGKNTTEQIRALGEWITNAKGVLTGMGASPPQIASVIAPAETLVEKLRTQAAQLTACTGGNCSQ